MKTLEEFQNILDTVGIPWCEGRNEEEEDVELPYMVYMIVRQNPFFADGILYFYSARIELAVYTDQPREEITKRLDDAFSMGEIAYEKESGYIKKPIDCYETIYTLEV